MIRKEDVTPMNAQLVSYGTEMRNVIQSFIKMKLTADEYQKEVQAKYTVCITK
jgi:hypothetical protein